MSPLGQSLPKRDVRVTSVIPQSRTLFCVAANDAKGQLQKLADLYRWFPAPTFQLRIFGSYERDAMSGKVQLLS